MINKWKYELQKTFDIEMQYFIKLKCAQCIQNKINVNLSQKKESIFY